MDQHASRETGTAMGAAGRRGPSNEQLLLTAEEAAHALNVGRTTLYALMRNGQLRSVHIGRSCRLTRAELLRYVAQLDAAEELGSPQAPPVSITPAYRGGRARKATNQVRLLDLDPMPPGAA